MSSILQADLDLTFVIENLRNGLQSGLMLFLLAVGLTLGFGVMDFIILSPVHHRRRPCRCRDDVPDRGQDASRDRDHAGRPDDFPNLTVRAIERGRAAWSGSSGQMRASPDIRQRHAGV
jgi:hypothetical protein